MAPQHQSSFRFAPLQSTRPPSGGYARTTDDLALACPRGDDRALVSAAPRKLPTHRPKLWNGCNTMTYRRRPVHRAHASPSAKVRTWARSEVDIDGFTISAKVARCGVF